MNNSIVHDGAAAGPPRSLTTDMERRVAGFRRLADRLRAVPVHLRTAWVAGQLRYAEAELLRLEEAMELMGGPENASPAAT